MQALRAGEIEEGLVDRDRLHQRRQLEHELADLRGPTRNISSMFGLDHHGVGAGRQRLEHRHGRAHAIGAGDVAGGRDDAALAAADDQRLVGEARDRRAFRSAAKKASQSTWAIASDVELRVGEQARRPARAAAAAALAARPGSAIQAVAAAGGVAGRASAASGRVGCWPIGDESCARFHDSAPAWMASASWPSEREQHAASSAEAHDGRARPTQEARRRRSLADRVGRQARQVEEAAEPLGVGGDEAEGFEGQIRSAPRSRRSCRSCASVEYRFAFHQRVGVRSIIARADEPPGERDEPPARRPRNSDGRAWPKPC